MTDLVRVELFGSFLVNPCVARFFAVQNST